MDMDTNIDSENNEKVLYNTPELNYSRTENQINKLGEKA